MVSLINNELIPKKTNAYLIKILEPKILLYLEKNNTKYLFYESIQTLIIEGNFNIIYLYDNVDFLIIQGIGNKIICGKKENIIKKVIFKGNNNIIKLKGKVGKLKLNDEGYYNYVFKKIQKNIELKTKIHFNIYNLNLFCKNNIIFQFNF